MKDDLTTIIDKYLNGKASADEREIVDAWYLSFACNPDLTSQFSAEELAKTMAANFAALSAKLDLPEK